MTDDADDARVDPLDDSVAKASALLEADRPDLAESLLRRALGRRPDDPWLQLMLGRVHLARDEDEQAVECFSACLAGAPQFGAAHELLGVALMECGRHREAERALLDGLALDPTSASGFQIYATLMVKTGHLEKAEALVRRALVCDPDSDASHSLLAGILTQRGDRGGARAHGARSLDLDPDSDASHASVASAAFVSGRPFEARRHFREALRIDPSDTSTQESYRETDKCCRVVYLPMYYWTLLVDRLPGKQFAVWVAFLALVFGGPALGVPEQVTGAIVLGYLVLVVYTWVAYPLVNLWVKLVPPR